jgi:hypothetical protein
MLGPRGAFPKGGLGGGIIREKKDFTVMEAVAIHLIFQGLGQISQFTPIR